MNELNAIVTLVNRISPWLTVLQVVPDGWTAPDFNPGQYITVGLYGAAARCDLAEPEPVPADPHKLIRRAYCIASSPAHHEFLEFFIHLVPHGALSPRLFALQIGDRIHLGDHTTGAFTFDHVPKDANVALIATGTGLAPYVSMLSTHLRFGTQRRVAVLHGVRNSWDLGYRSILMTMQHLRSNVTYVPVISRPINEPVPWPRTIGHVQDVWKGPTLAQAWGSKPTPEDAHVFLCGSPHMIDSMAGLLTDEGFREHADDAPGQIHVERYWHASSDAAHVSRKVHAQPSCRAGTPVYPSDHGGDRMDVALVTGGTGFIGSHVVRSLLDRGVAKVIVSNVSGGARNLEDVRERVEIARADVGIFTDVLRLVEKHRPQTVFHIGAMLAPACDDDPEAGIRANGLGTYHVLEAARLFSARQVIFATSLSVFGGAATARSVVDDDFTTHPETIYASAKLFSENLGLCYRRLYGLDYRGIRLPNVNGPGTTTHGYLEYFNKAIEESAQGRAYTIYVEPHVRIPIMHVADAARAFVELAAAPSDAIRTVNYIVLGPTPAPTAQDLVDAVKTRWPDAKLSFNVDARISALIDAVGGQAFDDHYARSEWGWRHQYDLPSIIESFTVPQTGSRARINA